MNEDLKIVISIISIFFITMVIKLVSVEVMKPIQQAQEVLTTQNKQDKTQEQQTRKINRAELPTESCYVNEDGFVEWYEVEDMANESDEKIGEFMDYYDKNCKSKLTNNNDKQITKKPIDKPIAQSKAQKPINKNKEVVKPAKSVQKAVNPISKPVENKVLQKSVPQESHSDSAVNDFMN